jgi:hypothetical protein
MKFSAMRSIVVNVATCLSLQYREWKYRREIRRRINRMIKIIRNNHKVWDRENHEHNKQKL